MRGEFIRGDGLVIPNNITNYGKQVLLETIFWHGATPQGAFQLGLCDAVYSPNMEVADLNQPSAAGGYGLRDIDRVQGNWTTGLVNGEAFAESVPITWEVVAPGYNRAISKLFLLYRNLKPIALSGSLPQPLRITPATPAVERTFRYRLYLG